MATSDKNPELGQRQSPLAHRKTLTGDGDLAMHEAALLGKIILRADEKLAEKSIKAAINGASLPKAACTSTNVSDSQVSILWLGPDEWMIVCAPDGEQTIIAGLEKALNGKHFQISDVSDYYTCIDISGENSREIMMNLSTLDLHPSVFKRGDIKGSVFGHANAWLWHLSTNPGQSEAFRLIIRASMADYMWCLLAKSGKCFGLPAEKPITGEKLVV
ncbi:MAG: hypothetical protein COA52_19365 [Hyphomicrobiales bacterium]|nr:MAG: hypothetical protein COA52_19365 [Hyphomicrobiales bacterium]